MKIKSLVAAACMALAGTAALADGHGGKVKVGMITTLSGGGAGLGIDVRDGFLLAAKGNDMLDIVVEDDQQKPDIAQRRTLRAGRQGVQPVVFQRRMAERRLLRGGWALGQ